MSADFITQLLSRFNSPVHNTVIGLTMILFAPASVAWLGFLFLSLNVATSLTWLRQPGVDVMHDYRNELSEPDSYYGPERIEVNEYVFLVKNSASSKMIFKEVLLDSEIKNVVFCNVNRLDENGQLHPIAMINRDRYDRAYNVRNDDVEFVYIPDIFEIFPAGEIKVFIEKPDAVPVSGVLGHIVFQRRLDTSIFFARQIEMLLRSVNLLDVKVALEIKRPL